MGRRTAGGAPLLATDPHLALSAPSIWMLARIDLAEGPVMGGTIPGIPAVIVGRNADLGWGLTSSYLDDQDVYIEKLNPENPEEYLTPAGFRPFETREAVIGVRGAEPVRVRLRWTRHGPVIPGDNFGAAAVTPPGHVASPRLDGADGQGPFGQHVDRADAGAFGPGRARGGARVSGAVAEHHHGRPRLGGAADGGRGAGAARGAHEPGAHPGAGVARASTTGRGCGPSTPTRGSSTRRAGSWSTPTTASPTRPSPTT